MCVWLLQILVVAVAPIDLLEGAALLMSLVVQQEPRLNSYHSRYRGGVHLKRRTKWRVNAAASPTPILLFPQTVAGVCISHTVSGTGWGSTKGVSGEGRMSSTSRMMMSYAVGSEFGEIGEPPCSAVVVTAVESLKQKVLNTSARQT